MYGTIGRLSPVCGGCWLSLIDSSTPAAISKHTQPCDSQVIIIIIMYQLFIPAAAGVSGSTLYLYMYAIRHTLPPQVLTC